MSEVLTVYRCAEHGIRVAPLGPPTRRRCDYYVTNAQCKQSVEPVVMAPVEDQPVVRRVEVRGDDLVLFWPNGDPAVKFQADGFIALAHMQAHPLDSVAMQLGADIIEQLRAWCDARLEA